MPKCLAEGAISYALISTSLRIKYQFPARAVSRYELSHVLVSSSWSRLAQKGYATIINSKSLPVHLYKYDTSMHDSG